MAELVECCNVTRVHYVLNINNLICMHDSCHLTVDCLSRIWYWPWGQCLLWVAHNWMPSISFPKLGNTCLERGFLARTAWFCASDLWKYLGAASTIGQVLSCIVLRVKLLVFVINILSPEKQTFGKYACNYHLKSCNHRMAYPFVNLLFYHGKWNLIHEFLSVSFLRMSFTIWSL